MNIPDYNSPAALKKILDENGYSMQKKFGQNFLINADARKRLVDTLFENAVPSETTVWEVGPGLGSMTSEILNRDAHLTAFEIDKGFISLISKYFDDFSSKGSFSIIEGDVLKNWKKELKRLTENGQNAPDFLFGNLPYNIAAALIADTIEEGIRFKKCVFTVQKEVAQRMCAKQGSEDYSSFSVLCQWAYDVKPILDLTGGNFWPKPNVDSRAVLMTPKADFPGCKEPAFFVKLQRILFSSRRKNLRNNMCSYFKDNDFVMNVLEQAGIDSRKRAEVLSIKEMLHLCDVITEIKATN